MIDQVELLIPSLVMLEAISSLSCSSSSKNGAMTIAFGWWFWFTLQITAQMVQLYYVYLSKQRVGKSWRAALMFLFCRFFIVKMGSSYNGRMRIILGPAVPWQAPAPASSWSFEHTDLIKGLSKVVNTSWALAQKNCSFMHTMRGHSSTAHLHSSFSKALNYCTCKSKTLFMKAVILSHHLKDMGEINTPYSVPPTLVREQRAAPCSSYADCWRRYSDNSRRFYVNISVFYSSAQDHVDPTVKTAVLFIKTTAISRTSTVTTLCKVFRSALTGLSEVSTEWAVDTQTFFQFIMALKGSRQI